MKKRWLVLAVFWAGVASAQKDTQVQGILFNGRMDVPLPHAWLPAGPVQGTLGNGMLDALLPQRWVARRYARQQLGGITAKPAVLPASLASPLALSKMVMPDVSLASSLESIGANFAAFKGIESATEDDQQP